MKIAVFFLLLRTILAQTYVDINCDNTCIERDERNDCVECSKLGCTPDGEECRPFTCAWVDLLDDWTDQAYDVTCNWNELQDIAPKMSVDNGCSTVPIDCTKSQWSHPQGGIWKDLILYRQSNNCGNEPECPSRTNSWYQTTRGTTCSLTCRSDGASGGQRTCSMDPDKLELCKRRCVEGNRDCPDFSCHELQASWTGDFNGGKWDVCWDPYTNCGNSGMYSSGTRCCSHSSLGIGTAAAGSSATGKEAGCEDHCECNRICSRHNSKNQCVAWSNTGARCCGAMSLSLMLIIVTIAFNAF